MSPKVTRRRQLSANVRRLGVRRPNGMRIRTLPWDRASGASLSLTPTPVTAFLLNLWPCRRAAGARLDSQGLCRNLRTHDSGVALTSRLQDRPPPSWPGVELRQDRRRYGGLQAMRYPLSERLN